MDILAQIVGKKKEWVASKKRNKSLEELKHTADYSRSIYSLSTNIRAGNGHGIIAEFKRKSPSKGNIFIDADVVEVTKDYQSAGASAISILTDQEFFGGSDEDLINARKQLTIPILRKDFIVDPYQIVEAKSIGADIILLIAACLTKQQVSEFSQLAKSIGLEVLLELHDEVELEHISRDVDFVGINNRSLKTFDVNVERSLKMAAAIPDGYIKVAESGIDQPGQVRLFKDNGYGAFLIGEYFMKTRQPGQSLEQFIQQI